MTITKYICWKYTDSNCSTSGKSDLCKCDNGTYSVTFRWDVPNTARLNYHSIKCVLFEEFQYPGVSILTKKADLNCDKVGALFHPRIESQHILRLCDQTHVYIY